METMTESGVLPHPHPYLGSAGNPNTPSGIHPGFFPGSSRESDSTVSPTPGAPNDEPQQSYPGTNFSRTGPAPTHQDYPQLSYKQQQFQQGPFSRDQGQGSGRPDESYHPQRPGQSYPSDGGAPADLPAYINAHVGFDRAPDSRTFGFSRNPNAPAASSPFPPSSQSGFRSQHHQHLISGAVNHRSSGDIQSEESPLPNNTHGKISDQQEHSMFSHQKFFGHNGKDHSVRGRVAEDRINVDANFASPNFYEKHQRGFTGYDTAHGGDKSFVVDGCDFSPAQSKKQPAHHDSIKGFLRSSDTEAEPMAHDSNRFANSDRSGFNTRDVGLKSREFLERSVSHDVQPVAWGPHLDPMREARDADGRPLRSLTLDPSFHMRHSRHELSPHKDYSQRSNMYPHIQDRRSSLQQEDDVGSDQMDSYRKQEKGQGDGMMLSPVKPTRLLSDNGQSIRDAESAAVPQQSPNRPGPPTFHPDRMSQQAPYTKGGKPEDGMMSTELLSKDPAPSQPQELPVWTASSVQPNPNPESSPRDSPEFRSPIPGDNSDNPNRAGSEGRAEHQREDDSDDVDGDPKAGTSDNSMYRDGKPRSPSRETNGSVDGNTTKSNMKGSDSPPMYHNNRNSARDPSLERDHPGEGDDGMGFTAKRELFSEDEDEEGSQDAGSRREHYPGTSSPRSMSPPSPDSSMTYPPHYAHPFFSPSRGMNPPMSFGGHRGGPHPDTGAPGFPFGKAFPGPFPMSGMGGTPEMGMGGLARMGEQRGHSAHPRFMNPMTGMDDEHKDIYFCHLCSYSGKTKSDFDSHMSIHFEFNCPHCDYTSRTEGRLKRHIKDFHSDDSNRRSMPGRPKIYRCKQCPFSAKEKDKFWEHARSHIKEDKLLQCPKCSFVTEYKHHLEYHLRNHFGSKPFKCTKCNYSCVNKSMLNSHMKSHTNVYQYRCSECTYATKYCHSLKLHLKKYGHKPATVLNQDGSLPQGLDVDASGLSVATKRGPPRGPRGPRKDKGGGGGGPGGDPYLNQLFGMPPVPMGVPGMGAHAMGAINPMLNGMMPFWPMLPHGPGGMGGHAQGPHHTSPSQPGMLPGMGSLAHRMRLDRPGPRMMPPHRLDQEPAHPSEYNNLPMGKAMNRGSVIGRPHSSSSDDRRNGVFGEEGNGRESFLMIRGNSGKHDYPACSLCDFIAENTRELCMHYVDVHKEDPARVFGMMRGGRGEEKVEFPFPSDVENDRERSMFDREGLEMERRRLSEPPFDAVSEHDHPNNDLHRRNSLAGLLPRKGTANRARASEDGLQAPWQGGPAFPDRDGLARMGGRYPSVDSNPEADEECNKSLKKNDTDTNILHQMTLKFGNDAPLEREREEPSRDVNPSFADLPARTRNEESSNSTARQPQQLEDKGRRAGRPHKETPLDLTKPKPDSPSDFDNSRSPVEHGEEQSVSSEFISGPEGKEESGKSLSKVTETLLKKRPYPEEFQDGDNKTPEPSVTAIVPRKRSRKGKAYKLDTICLKLQEQQNTSPLDSDGNESDMEMGFSGFQPLFPTFNSMEKKNGSDSSETQELDQTSKEPTVHRESQEKDVADTAIDAPHSAEIDGVDSDGTEDYTNDERKDDFDDFKKVGEMTKVVSTEGEGNDQHNISKEVNEDHEKTEKSAPSSEQTDRNETSTDDRPTVDSKKINDEDDEEDEETGFEKLQRSLKLLNGGEDPSDAETEKVTARPVKDGTIESKSDKNESVESISINDYKLDVSGSVDPANPIKTENSDVVLDHRITSECHSDKENSDAVPEIPGSFEASGGEPGVEKMSLAPEELSSVRQSNLEQCSFDSDEEIDQADLIHTVLENRKKPLPPAVRRGTELAWKLLNDPVNPVTSLPIPVVASTSSPSSSENAAKERPRPGSPALLPSATLPASRARLASPEPPLPTPHPHPFSGGQATSVPSRPLIGPASSSPTLLRNGMRQHGPAYRQLHQYQQHSPYQGPPPPLSLHRNSHPIFPPPHHYGALPGMSPSSGSSPIPMKPSGLPSPASSTMPIPLPPTPMAFIPPTNRMERIPDQASSPGVPGEPGINSHTKPQVPASLQQKSELYECTYCDLTFRDCVMYTVHMGYHSNRNPFKCNSCGIICRDKVEFFLHIARSPHA